MDFMIHAIASLKESFSQALADSIYRLVKNKTTDDGESVRMQELAASLGISDSSASQRIRVEKAVPFKAFEMLRLMVVFRKPIYEIISMECFLTEKELADDELLRSMGFPVRQKPMKGRKQCLVSEEEERILHELRELSEEEKSWLLEYFNMRKKRLT